jgi:rhodanese-related sulfurtransferase
MGYDHGGRVRDLTPIEVAEGMAEGRMLLVDIREPSETAVERYPGAIDMPMSAFDPTELQPGGKTVVFACRSGNRSAMLSVACQDAGFPFDAHLAGGIIAWKAAGLPTES